MRPVSPLIQSSSPDYAARHFGVLLRMRSAPMPRRAQRCPRACLYALNARTRERCCPRVRCVRVHAPDMSMPLRVRVYHACPPPPANHELFRMPVFEYLSVASHVLLSSARERCPSARRCPAMLPMPDVAARLRRRFILCHRYLCFGATVYILTCPNVRFAVRRVV